MKRILSALFVAFCGLIWSAPARAITPQEDWRTVTLRQIEQTQQVLAKEPNLTSYYKLGGLYDLLGKWNEAADAYTKGIALKPEHVDSHLVLGWCYAKLGRYTDALASHQRAVALNPKSVAALFAIGWDLYSLKRYEEAVSAYQQTMARESKDAGVRYELGRAYIALGKRELALEQLQVVEKRDRELAQLLQREMDRMPTTPTAVPPQIGTTPQPPPTQAPPPAAFQAPGVSLRPTILHKEKAKYTEAARRDRVSGIVLISAVFTADGRMTSFRVVRGLPMGLSEQAIKAAEAIRFTPAKKDGNPVSVRMSIEFSFNLL